MRFELSQVLPWGRSFDEYVRMFDLKEEDLGMKILGCADGPASFNDEMNRRGIRVVSCDPIYRFSRKQLSTRIDQACEEIIEQTRKNAGNFVWSSIGSIEDLRDTRTAAMAQFMADYDEGKEQGRYVNAELPVLPFDDGAFDIALCSHFLFLYSNRLSLEFHRESVRQLCRIAKDVRIFPLIDLDLRPSPYVQPMVQSLEKNGFTVSIERVPYEFQRGGNEMLRIMGKTQQRRHHRC
ncbi:MAG: SAM-dependent methyltransferase [Planctomycetes bacterium B3_Pla]|nr:MAG: SAM-dependent methyltransferase [Planctomycetes bacterium B3_Pla]